MRRILRKIAGDAVDEVGDTIALADQHVVEVWVKGKQQSRLKKQTPALSVWSMRGGRGN